MKLSSGMLRQIIREEVMRAQRTLYEGPEVEDAVTAAMTAAENYLVDCDDRYEDINWDVAWDALRDLFEGGSSVDNIDLDEIAYDAGALDVEDSPEFMTALTDLADVMADVLKVAKNKRLAAPAFRSAKEILSSGYGM